MDMRNKAGFQVDLGFTYIGLMLFIAITGILLSVAGISWQYEVRAEKEQQLLFVGNQFRAAINSYYVSALGDAKVYPLSLNDLLLDKRMPNIRRHLRQIYLDPFTEKADWGLVTQEGRIVGVYSSSTLKPLKHSGFNRENAKFSGAKSYQDWIFGEADGIKSSHEK